MLQSIIKQKRPLSGPVLFNGALGRIRTPDLLIRSQTLYPAELRARMVGINAAMPNWLLALQSGWLK